MIKEKYSYLKRREIILDIRLKCLSEESNNKL